MAAGIVGGGAELAVIPQLLFLLEEAATVVALQVGEEKQRRFLPSLQVERKYILVFLSLQMVLLLQKLSLHCLALCHRQRQWRR